MQHYSDGTLRSIGERCTGKLPPASAVQAMFLYETQRQSEEEKLFQGQMFELAQVRDDSMVQDARIWDVEDAINAIKKQMASKDIEERLATSKTRSDVLQVKLKQQEVCVEGHGKRLGLMETRQEETNAKLVNLTLQQETFDNLAQDLSKRFAVLDCYNIEDTMQDREKVTKLNEAVTLMVEKMKSMDKTTKGHAQQLEQSLTHAGDITHLKTELEAIKTRAIAHDAYDNDLGILFDERNALAAQLQHATDRISKLEDLVRAITAQQTPTTSNGSSPSLYQILPVHTSDGQPLELRVPKGHPFRGSSPPRTKKENSPPRKGDIRSFTPGQQWS